MIARPGRFVICGVPNSGKSTYVRERARPGDLVWDLDHVASVIGYGGSWTPGRRLSWPVAKAALVMRDALVEWLASVETLGDARVYFIVTDRQVAKDCAEIIGAQVVDLSGRNGALRADASGSSSWRWRDAQRHEGAVI